MSTGDYLLIILGVVVGIQLWRSLRVILTQTVHRFQSYDDVTKPYSQRYRESSERITSGRYIGRYEGASTGKHAVRFGWRLFILALLGVIGWLMLLIDTLLGTGELGTLSALGLCLIFLSMGIMSVVDYLDQRSFKMRRLR